MGVKRGNTNKGLFDSFFIRLLSVILHSNAAVETYFNGVWYFPNSIKHNIPEPLESFLSGEQHTAKQSDYLEGEWLVWGCVGGGSMRAKVPLPTPEWLIRSQHKPLDFETRWRFHNTGQC